MAIIAKKEREREREESHKNRFYIAIHHIRITCLIVLGKTLRSAGSSSFDLTLF